MSSARFAIGFLFLGSLLWGQADAINVTTTKTVDFAPDEITFNVAVLGEQDVTLEQVLQAVKESGIATKDLTGIISTQQYGPGPSQVRLVFQFALTAPFSKFKETLDKFAAVRRSLLADSNNLELQTYFISVSASDTVRAQVRQQVIPDLIQEARKNGEFLAKAAGVSLGPILGLTDSVSTPLGVPGPFFGPAGPTALKTTFALSVRFAVR